MTGSRPGGRVLAEALAGAGVEVVFGVPGIHALALWDSLTEVPLRFIGLRTELSAGFAADGYARVSRRPGVLLTTTGPGAFVATAALMEAATAFVPMLNVVTAIPRVLIGAGRGYLHEAPNQSTVLASFAKWHAVAQSPDEIPELVRHGLRVASEAPPGPVVLEVPVDVLSAASTVPVPPEPLRPQPSPGPTPEELDRAAQLLREARSPVVIAGGGVLRAGAHRDLAGLAELLDAPVLTTYQGKGAIPASHPLFAGSGCYEGAYRRLIEESDVALAVGTELGSETTAGWTIRMPERLIHLEARADHAGRNYPCHGLVGDAAAVLPQLLDALPDRQSRQGGERARSAREQARGGLADAPLERELLSAIREAATDRGITAFDMTIAGYLAASHFDVQDPGTFLYPLGSGTLGYAWPAAIGAGLAAPDRPVLAVHGDGGVLYNIVELLTAAQYGIDAKLLVIDDRGYGILRQVQLNTYGRSIGVDLAQPDFPALAGALGVPVHRIRPDRLAEDLGAAMRSPGPALLHLPATLAMPARSR